MADEFAEELLEIACAQILGAGGRFSSARASTLSMLASVARVRIERLAEAAARSARHAGRDRVNITDIARVLGEEELLGIGPP
jgi:histone H3/H4